MNKWIRAWMLSVCCACSMGAAATDLTTAFEYLRTGEFQKALPIMQTLAEQGNAVAQGNLGTMYLRGDGVSQDVNKAAQWYEKSATSGQKHQQVVNSMFQMAALSRGYRGHPVNLSKAAYWYEQAANAGDVEAMNQLGILYYDGQGVEKNYTSAFQWFSKAAEQHHPEAQSFIGDLYRFGRSVKQDYAEAFRWYEKAATKNYPHALFMLGVLYGTGQGVVANRTQAMNYYERAASQGYPEANKMLAEMRQQSPVKIVGVTLDSDYGYTAEKAIRTGGRNASYQRAYLDRLRGPNGQSLQYRRAGGACSAYKDESQPFGQALIDCYTITYEGQDKPVTLYLDFYRAETLWAPRGFTYLE